MVVAAIWVYRQKPPVIRGGRSGSHTIDVFEKPVPMATGLSEDQWRRVVVASSAVTVTAPAAATAAVEAHALALVASDEARSAGKPQVVEVRPRIRGVRCADEDLFQRAHIARAHRAGVTNLGGEDAGGGSGASALDADCA